LFFDFLFEKKKKKKNLIQTKQIQDLPGVVLGPVLGRGAFGLVRLGTIDTGAVVAVKVKHKKKLF
jgi:hypothetical protein